MIHSCPPRTLLHGCRAKSTGRRIIPPEGGFREYIAIRYIVFRAQEERKEVCERDNTAKGGGSLDRRAVAIGDLDAVGAGEGAGK